jgi:putative endonuclease
MAALAEYRRRGYSLVAQNWSCSIGELDLVLGRPADRLIVFCEVKTRAGSGFGGPFEAVNWRKQRKLRQLAEVFLASSSGFERVRFDVASVLFDRAGVASVHVFEDAF